MRHSGEGPTARPVPGRDFFGRAFLSNRGRGEWLSLRRSTMAPGSKKTAQGPPFDLVGTFRQPFVKWGSVGGGGYPRAMHKKSCWLPLSELLGRTSPPSCLVGCGLLDLKKAPGNRASVRRPARGSGGGGSGAGAHGQRSVRNLGAGEGCVGMGSNQNVSWQQEFLKTNANVLDAVCSLLHYF